MVARHLVIILPICGALAALPGTLATRLGTAGLLFVGGVFTVATAAEQLRNARLRQHRIIPPQRAGLPERPTRRPPNPPNAGPWGR